MSRWKRALIVVRLSRTTDATTSPERQRRDCEAFCENKNWDVVGVAEDLDVSAGKFAPWERPSLKEWLDRSDEYDVIVCWRVDRFVRRTAHLQKMIEWSEEHGVELASATESYFDLTDPRGKLMVQMVAMFAEMELDAISERNSSAAQYNIKAGKWRGGMLPLGYRPEKTNGDWRLVPDDEPGHVKPYYLRGENGKPIGDPITPADVPMVPAIRDIVERVIAGERLSRIVQDLNARGVPTGQCRAAALAGREPREPRWTISNLRRMLLSPTILGRVVHRPVVTDENGNPKKVKGKKVYGPEQVLFENGEPLQRAEPLISEVDFHAVQRILTGPNKYANQGPKTIESPLLLQVLHCGVCGRPMWRLKGGPGRKQRYRCGSTQSGKACGNPSFVMEQADRLVNHWIAGFLGDIPHMEEQRVSWFDHASEIETIDARLESLAASVGDFPVGTSAYESVRKQIRDLSSRREELAAQPKPPSGTQWVPTGKTFREHWESLDTTQRNDYLRKYKVRLLLNFHPDNDGPTIAFSPGDLASMIRAANPEFADMLAAGEYDWLDMFEDFIGQRVSYDSKLPQWAEDVATQFNS